MAEAAGEGSSKTIDQSANERISFTVFSPHVRDSASADAPAQVDPPKGRSRPIAMDDCDLAVTFRLSKHSKSERMGVTLQTYAGQDGVIISALERGCTAELAGASTGDKIIAINNVRVHSANTAAEMLKNSLGDVEVVVERCAAPKARPREVEA